MWQRRAIGRQRGGGPFPFNGDERVAPHLSAVVAAVALPVARAYPGEPVIGDLRVIENTPAEQAAIIRFEDIEQVAAARATHIGVDDFPRIRIPPGGELHLRKPPLIPPDVLGAYP